MQHLTQRWQEGSAYTYQYSNNGCKKFCLCSPEISPKPQPRIYLAPNKARWTKGRPWCAGVGTQNKARALLIPCLRQPSGSVGMMGEIRTSTIFGTRGEVSSGRKQQSLRTPRAGRQCLCPESRSHGAAQCRGAAPAQGPQTHPGERLGGARRSPRAAPTGSSACGSRGPHPHAAPAGLGRRRDTAPGGGGRRCHVSGRCAWGGPAPPPG